MIQSFADDTTVDLFRECNTRHARRLPRHLWRVAQRKLKALDVAARLDDLRIPRRQPTGAAEGHAVLLDEFLEPLGLRQSEAAQQLGISANRLNEVVLGKRRITPDTALRLARLLKTSHQFWMRLRADWDLHRATERAAS